MRRSSIMVISLILLSLFLVSCAGDFAFNPFVRQNNANRQYYAGGQGVIMRFSDPQSPPGRLYYYEDADRDDNAFQVLVDVHNVGSSWTRGGR
jgi:hypothetical protein